MDLHDDLQLICNWIPVGNRVLDLGCGDGRLLTALVGHKEHSSYGVEIDTDSIIETTPHGVNVIQADLEQDSEEFDDNAFDVIALSQTIRSMQNTEMVLRGLIYVAKQAVVTSPDFGYQHNYFQIALGGHMPVSERMPYHWYDTSDVHRCTLKGFGLLCARSNIRMLERAVMARNRRVRHLSNLLESLVLYRVEQ